MPRSSFLDRDVGAISLYKLEVFTAVVRAGGVRRVAEQLRVSQPAVSAHLKDLQDRVGVQLLHWTGHEMRLTEAGKMLYSWAEETLERAREVVDQAGEHASGHRGRALIASSLPAGPYLVDEILARFAERHPGVTLSVTTDFPLRLAERLLAGERDLAVLVDEERSAKDRGLDYEVVGVEEVVLVVAADRPPFGATATPAEVAACRFVIPPRETIISGTFMRDQLGPAGVLPLDVVGEYDHPEGIKHAVRHGVGATFLTRRAVAREIEAGELRVVTIKGIPLALPVMVARGRGRWLSPMHEELRRVLRDELRTMLA